MNEQLLNIFSIFGHNFPLFDHIERLPLPANSERPFTQGYTHPYSDQILQRQLQSLPSRGTRPGT